MKNFMKKPLLFLALIMAALPCYAVTVFDPTNFVQNTLTATNSITQVQQQAEQIENELKMISMMKTNLVKTDISILNKLQNQLTNLDMLLNDAADISYNLSETEAEFNNLYPEYTEFQGIQTYQQKYLDWNKQVREGVYSAMHSQGLADQASDDTITLSNLIAASNNAEGQLEAIQIGNQIAALLVKQLMELRQIIAANGRAQTSYLAKVAAEEAAENTARQYRRSGLGDYTRIPPLSTLPQLH